MVYIKQEFVDKIRKFQLSDFPKVDACSVDTLYIDKTDMHPPLPSTQIVYIYLSKTGEAEVRKAVQLLSDNPLVRKSSLWYEESPD